MNRHMLLQGGEKAVNYILYFDICALVIFTITVFIFYFRKNIRNKRHQIFGAMMWSAFLSTLFDIISVWVDCLVGEYPMGVLILPHVLYYLFHIATPFFFCLYVIFLTQQPKIVNKKLMAFIRVPFIIEILLVLTTPFTKWIFTYDNGIYQRGPYQIVMYAISLFYLIYALIHIVMNRSEVSKQVFSSVCSFVALTLVPTLMQCFMPQYLIECFGSSVCILLVLLTLHNNDDLIDKATGLMNRFAFTRKGIINFKAGNPYAVLLVRISDYDLLQRSFGVEVNNQIITKFSEYLQNLVPLGDAYYLEDETFAIVFVGADKQNAENVKLKIERRTLSPWQIDFFDITFSTLILRIDNDPNIKNINHIFEYVNYIKSIEDTGRASINICDVDINAKKRADEVGLAVNSAIVNGGFDVYYQPIYSLDKRRITSAEALVRLKDPILGQVFPDEFIPLAEKTGAIIKIDDFVFNRVCKFIAIHDLDKLGLDSIEINLSAVDCMQPMLSRKIIETISHYGIAPEKICFEITETAACNATDILKQNINDLAEYGFSFAMDDYGTGYTNIISMLEIPLKFMKVDKSLVWSSMKNRRARIALESTVSMIANLDMQIIAEGIETEEHIEYMDSIGADFLQGYYYSKPVCEKDFLDLLARQQSID